MAKRKSIMEQLAIGKMTADLVLKNLFFVFFIGFLATTYIASAHFAEKQVRDIQELQKKVKELRWRYMSLKSDLMFNTKQSEVSKAVAPIKLKMRSAKPKKVIVEPD